MNALGFNAHCADPRDLIQDLIGRMLRHVDQLLALDDEAFVKALYSSCFGRQPDADELSHHVGELRAGCGKTSLIADFAKFHASAKWRATLPGLKELLAAQGKSLTRGLGRASGSNRQLERQLNRLENGLGLTCHHLAQLERETRQRLTAIENRLNERLGKIPGMHAQSQKDADTAFGDSSDEADAMPVVTFSSAELSALPPVAGQILREITQALANVDDEAHL